MFFPPKLPHKLELEYASSRFRTIEINGTFYSLQKPSSFQSWKERTPEDFVFSIKASRYITHLLKLRNVRRPLANFFASGLLQLGPKLGPILWQFPPNFKYSSQTIEDFFHVLPADTEAASLLAREHDERLNGRASFQIDGKRPLRHAMEIRHDSFINPEFISLLRKYKVALVCADAVEWPRLMDVTSNFIYCRLHGSKELYSSGYGKKAIETWADRVIAWACGGQPKDGTYASDARPRTAKRRDVFVYFDNDAKVRAPMDAHSLELHVNRQLFGLQKSVDE